MDPMESMPMEHEEYVGKEFEFDNSNRQIDFSKNDSTFTELPELQNLNSIAAHENNINETKSSSDQRAEVLSSDDDDSSDDDSSEESDESSSEESSKIDFENDTICLSGDDDDDDATDSRKQLPEATQINTSEKKQKQGDPNQPLVDFEKLQLKDLSAIVVPEGTAFKQVGTFKHAMEYDRSVMVESIEGVPTFHLGTIFFRKNGEILGEVCDIIGNVKKPFYSLNFKTMEEISEKNLERDEPIFFAPANLDLTILVRNEDVITYGSDASGVGDKESSDREFSDDESETKHKKNRSSNPTTSWPPERKKAKVKRTAHSSIPHHSFQQHEAPQRAFFPPPPHVSSFPPASNYPVPSPYQQYPPIYPPQNIMPHTNPPYYNLPPPAFSPYGVPPPSQPNAQQWPPQPLPPPHQTWPPVATQQWPPQPPANTFQPYQNFNPYYR